jgi:hypothetical protein
MNRRRGSFDPVPDPGMKSAASSAWREVEPPRYCGAPAGVAAALALTGAALAVVLLVIR